MMAVKDVALVSTEQADLLRQPPAPIVPPAQSSPSDLVALIERVIAMPDVNVDKLQQIIALHDRAIAQRAKASFDAAFVSMQEEMPVIIERSKGNNNAKYAPLEDIVEVVRPILAKYGFSLSHRTDWIDKTILRVVGVLTHRDGHERTSEFQSLSDASGGKNAVQGIGSATHYGRRYTTNDLLCIVTRGEDDDARGTTKPVPTAPAGYDNWLTDLSAAADNGSSVLQTAWNKSKPEYREHLTKTAKAKLEGLKAKADAATKAAAKAAKS